MLIVRDSFVCKPGMASKVAKMMHDCFGAEARVMTDCVGNFNTVIMEFEAPDLAAYEKRLAEYMADESLHAKMKGYTEMYMSGKREVFRVVE